MNVFGLSSYETQCGIVFCLQQEKVVENQQPKPILQSVFPFVPPPIENVFYEEKPDSPSEDSASKPPLMDIERGYTSLEGHYAEEPMTSLNTHDPSSVIYDAPKVVQTWMTNEDQYKQQNEQINNNESNSSQNQLYNENSIVEDKTSMEQACPNSINIEDANQMEIIDQNQNSEENQGKSNSEENKENEVSSYIVQSCKQRIK